jgi:hypothetical protein
MLQEESKNAASTGWGELLVFSLFFNKKGDRRATNG